MEWNREIKKYKKGRILYHISHLDKTNLEAIFFYPRLFLPLEKYLKIPLQLQKMAISTQNTSIGTRKKEANSAAFCSISRGVKNFSSVRVKGMIPWPRISI